MGANEKTVVVVAVLCAVCIGYAIVLDKHPSWYLPDRTWITVMVGNGLIGLALWALELWGIPLSIGHYVLANVAAGMPIIVWQLVQVARRNGEIDSRKGGPHGTHSGRPGDR